MSNSFWVFRFQSYVGRLSERQARKHFQQLIDAVDYCHCRGVYHRDLKVRTIRYKIILFHNSPKEVKEIEFDLGFPIQPQNLLLDGKDCLKVSDFGLSTLRKVATWSMFTGSFFCMFSLCSSGFVLIISAFKTNPNPNPLPSYWPWFGRLNE